MPEKEWYCVDCGCRYLAKYGMLAEIHYKGVSTFILAEVINQDVDDVRAMNQEDELSPDSPKDLYEKLPVVLPVDPKDVLRQATKAEVKKEGVDHTKIMKLLHPDKLREIPKWDWDAIFMLLMAPQGGR